MSSDIVDQIKKLSINGGELNDYDCLLSLLTNLKTSDLDEVLRACDVMQLFTSMNLHDKEEMEAAIRLAKFLFAGVPLLKLLQTHQTELLHALDSGREELVEFVLNKIKEGSIGLSEDISCIPEKLLFKIIVLISSDEIYVARAASNCISSFCLHISGAIDQIFNVQLRTHFDSVFTKPEHILRLAELTVEVLNKCPNQFELIEKSGMLQPIADGMSSSDLLVNLNFIELAKSLLRLPVGYEWLERHGAFTNVNKRLSSLRKDEMWNVLMPGYLVFLGCLVRQSPSRWLRDENFQPGEELVPVFMNAMSNNDPVMQLTAMEAISHIAGTFAGRRELQQHLEYSGRLNRLFVKLWGMMHNANPQLSTRAIICLASFMRQPIEIPNSSARLDQANITLDWAAQLGKLEEPGLGEFFSVAATLRSAGKLVKAITGFANVPFVEERKAAWFCLVDLSTQPWAVRLFMDQAGWMEYLLNRKTEAGLRDASQLMQLKFDVVQGILNTCEMYADCDCPDFSVLLQPEQAACLRRYIREGIWGSVPAQATVAMESG